MLDREGNPACITIFSAPNYCGKYGNNGAIFCSRPEAVDVLTFEESQTKPIVLQMEGYDKERYESYSMERVDGISYFMDTLIGYSTQVILGMYMMGDDRLSRAMSIKSSEDSGVDHYKRTIVYESFKQNAKYAG